MLADFVDGALLVPILVGLRKNKLIQEDNIESLLTSLPQTVARELTTLFINKGWAQKQNKQVLLNS